MMRAHRNHAGWWAALLHRLSGVALAIFLPLHFLALGTALAGADALDRFLDGSRPESAASDLDIRERSVCAFLRRQVRIATEHCGSMDPLDLDAYLSRGGFSALRKAVLAVLPSA